MSCMPILKSTWEKLKASKNRYIHIFHTKTISVGFDESGVALKRLARKR